MQSKAKTVEEYLASLPDDRRETIQTVRAVILKNLDKDYEEGVQYGMISYFVPHRVFPAGYHCDPRQPLMFASLASQKNYMTLYLMCVYGHDGSNPMTQWFIDEWGKTGKKLDMGKACVRFKKLDDLALEVIGQAVKRVPAKKYLDNYLSVLNSRPARKARNKSPEHSAKPDLVKKRRAVRGKRRVGKRP